MVVVIPYDSRRLLVALASAVNKNKCHRHAGLRPDVEFATNVGTHRAVSAAITLHSEINETPKNRQDAPVWGLEDRQ